MSYCAAENTERAMQQLLELIDEGAKDVDIREQTTEGYALESVMELSRELQRIIQDKIDEAWE
jgi:dihydropteroate synthase